jgi:hypothetical protein
MSDERSIFFTPGQGSDAPAVFFSPLSKIPGGAFSTRSRLPSTGALERDFAACVRLEHMCRRPHWLASQER